MAESSGEKQKTVVSGRPPSGSSTVKKGVKKLTGSGSFEILSADDKTPTKSGSAGSEGRQSKSTSSLVRSSSAGRVQSGRRSNTPTKQVSLQAVKRKEEKDEDLGEFNWEEHKQLEEQRFAKMNGHTDETQAKVDEGAIGGVTSDMDALRVADTSSQEGSSEGESDSEAEDEEETIKAPNDLICEFLSCIMNNDWLNAQKLCKMVLIYEPEHKEALEYQALIEEMLRQEEEESESGESGDDSDDDDDDDEDDDGDDDEDGSDDTSAEESGEETENKKETTSNATGDTSSKKWQPTNL